MVTQPTGPPETSTSNRGRSVVAASIIAAVLAATGTWFVTRPGPGDPAQVQVVEGTTTGVTGARTAIVIETTERVPGTIDEAADGTFTAAYALPSDGEIGGAVAAEDCLPGGSSGQRVRLGVVNVAPSDAGPGGAIVVWYECLTPA